MILWQNNILAKSYLGIHTGRFPNKHTAQSKRFCKLVHEIAAIWLAEEPPIQRCLIFTGKQQQEHHEANGPPRNPNYVLLSLILIYWYDCAKLFAAPRVVQDWLAFYHHGCRDAGTPPCMNMLWSHALPIQVFHVKTVQPSLNLRCFGHETMSVDLSIGLCCVISVIVCKFCGLRLALPIANKPTPSKYSNRSANTQYQCNITKKNHQFEWKLHLHCATLLSLSNSRMQNPEHDCVAKFKGKSACSCFAAESNRT